MSTVKDDFFAFHGAIAARKANSASSTGVQMAAAPAKTQTDLPHASDSESWPRIKPAEATRPKWRQDLEDRRQLAAMEALGRLLRFQESLESTSGRWRQLRDFARANEGTRAAADAITLAGGSMGPDEKPLST